MFHLTFDTNALIDLIEDGVPHIRKRVLAARTLKLWHDNRLIEIHHSSWDEPLQHSDPRSSTLSAALQGITIDPNLTRVGYWYLDTSILASDEDGQLDKALTTLLPSSTEIDRFLLVTHFHHGHDIFVTSDKKLLKYHNPLLGLGITVMSPQQTVIHLAKTLFS